MFFKTERRQPKADTIFSACTTPKKACFAISAQRDEEVHVKKAKGAKQAKTALASVAAVPSTWNGIEMLCLTPCLFDVSTNVGMTKKLLVKVKQISL